MAPQGQALLGLPNVDRVVYIYPCLIPNLCLLYGATGASILVKFVSISTDKKAQRGSTVFGGDESECDGVIYLVNRIEKALFFSFLKGVSGT